MSRLWFFVLFMLVLIIGAATAVMVAWLRHGLTGLVVGLICYSAFLLLADITTSVIYYTYATFDPKSPHEDA
jgi:hypothetical protein